MADEKTGKFSLAYKRKDEALRPPNVPTAAGLRIVTTSAKNPAPPDKSVSFESAMKLEQIESEVLLETIIQKELLESPEGLAKIAKQEEQTIEDTLILLTQGLQKAKVWEVIEQFLTDESDGFADVTSDFANDPNGFPSFIGEFFEEKLFATEDTESYKVFGRSSPFPDLMGLVESKLTTAGEGAPIKVGAISLEGFIDSDLGSEVHKAAIKKIAAFKMMSKMANLLYGHAKTETKGGKHRFSIEKIDLFTTLIIDKVIDYIEKNQVVTVTAKKVTPYKGLAWTGSEWTTELFKQGYAININTGKNMENLLRIYMHKYNILDSTDNNLEARRALYGMLRNNSVTLDGLISKVVGTKETNPDFLK